MRNYLPSCVGSSSVLETTVAVVMVAFFALTLVASPTGAAAAPDARQIALQRPAARLTEPKTFEKDGQKLLYRWHAPKTLAPGKRYPLVILFHGAGERGSDNLAQLVHGADELLTYAQKTKEEIFFIAGQVPNGEQWVNTPWANKAHTMDNAPSRSMALALALIERTMKELPVDASRVYATGISMGGYGTWDIVQRRPDLFAAAMPICGGGDVACAAKIKDVPIWCFHGDKDGAVPTSRSRDMFAALKAVGGNVQYREYPGVGHNCWTRTYGDDTVLKWFFAQRKSGFKRLMYNNEGTTYLKSGLFSWPMIMDYDGDGDLDVVIRTGAIPTWSGTWFFENTGKKGDIHPVFKRARRIPDIGGDSASAQVLKDGRLAVTQEGRVTYDYVQNGMKNARAFAGLPRNVHTNNVRGNVWRFADLDGDGREDLVVGIGDWKQYGWHDSWDAAGVWKNEQIHGLFYYIRNETGADGVEKWAKPEILKMANGAPIDVYGYAAPLFADWDGDGDLDLLTCDFIDNFVYFENIGTKAEPKFAAGRPILDKYLKPIEADLCMVTATVADWDGDGHPDFITCEEDARICLYRNTGRVAMGLPVFDEPYRFRQERGEVHFGILATPSVIDWDGDGDQDIITGNSAGYVAFIENLSGPGVAYPKWAEPKLLEADGAPIRIIAGPNGSIQGPCEEKWGYTCLSTGDWDGDGLPDVMLNSIRGEIHWCRNVGTRTAPKLAPPEPVAAEWEGPQPELAWGWLKPHGSKNILTQWRTTPYMIDLDEDGLMDLVMLDVEGYLCLWRRAKKDGKLVVLPPARCLVDEKGQPLLLAGKNTKAGPKSNYAGGSGRRKFCFMDWTGDGKKDLICNSRNVMLYEFLKKENGKWYFANRGDLDNATLAGHTSNPTHCDFDGDGREELLVGAEDGFFYLLEH